MRIAREGYPFVAVAALVVSVAFVAGWKWTAALGIVVGLALAGFFRDPERIPPAGDRLVVSPADGKVVAVQAEASREKSGDGRTRVSIFLSPLDVHINRAPIAGRVDDVSYRRGEFKAAYKQEASISNERNSLTIQGSDGGAVDVVQIAGVLARRIVCYVKAGDRLDRGQRFGMIMFGSRVDLYLPERARVEVAVGQRVRGGETVIGRLA
jgi:phosphatidylserine decarboxylase